MPKPYPKEFRDDVVRVARQGDAPLTQIAADVGVSEARCTTGSNAPTSTMVFVLVSRQPILPSAETPLRKLLRECDGACIRNAHSGAAHPTECLDKPPHTLCPQSDSNRYSGPNGLTDSALTGQNTSR
ncbi:hypothetical protein HNP40_002180 [Mycobacteroides chelonae]|nr:hypothetical protein [Mycobacteroides chelonae]